MLRMCRSGDDSSLSTGIPTIPPKSPQKPATYVVTPSISMPKFTLTGVYMSVYLHEGKQVPHVRLVTVVPHRHPQPTISKGPRPLETKSKTSLLHHLRFHRARIDPNPPMVHTAAAPLHHTQAKSHGRSHDWPGKPSAELHRRAGKTLSSYSFRPLSLSSKSPRSAGEGKHNYI
jgi:hypothetical protein